MLERAEDNIRLGKQRERQANLQILRLQVCYQCIAFDRESTDKCLAQEKLACSQSGSRQSSVFIDIDPVTPATSHGWNSIRNTSTNSGL